MAGPAALDAKPDDDWTDEDDDRWSALATIVERLRTEREEHGWARAGSWTTLTPAVLRDVPEGSAVQRVAVQNETPCPAEEAECGFSDVRLPS